MKLHQSFLPLLLTILLASPIFAQGQFGPAPADIKGLVSRHFSAIGSADANKFGKDIDGGHKWINDTLLYFKTNIQLKYSSVQYNPQSNIALVKMGSKVDKRMSHDLLRDPRMQAKLRQKGLNPNQYMAFKVKKKNGRSLLSYEEYLN